MAIREDVERWSCFHFSLSNKPGLGQSSVPDLLRSVADTIETYGDIEIQDITFNSGPDLIHDEVDESWLTMTVYYTLPDLYVIDKPSKRREPDSRRNSGR